MSTSRLQKAPYHHGDLRSALLAAAAEVLEKEELSSLSLREVARRAGVSHNAPYRHFPDRESLLAALAAQGFGMLADAQREAANAEGLRGMGEAYVRFALAHPQRFQLMFGGAVQISRHPELREVATRTFEGLSGALADRAAGARGASDASVAAWALVHGLAHLLMDERIATAALAGRTREQFVRDVLSTLRFAAGPAQSA
jgi:AcrR family transcriptional regulator